MDRETRQKITAQIRNNLYYIIIFIASFVALVFLPMIGSTAGLALNFPDTPAGWIVYIGTKAIVAALNVIIFYSFMEQAKVNIRDNPNYKEALIIMGKYKDEQYKPMAPSKWVRKQYAGKGITIFISSLCGGIALTQALLSYDYITMISYLITIILGVVFGVLQMNKAEEYWTIEFYDYCKEVEREQQIKEQEEKKLKEELEKQNKEVNEDVNIREQGI